MSPFAKQFSTPVDVVAIKAVDGRMLQESEENLDLRKTKMQIRKIIFYILAVILGGCVPVASLYPLYDDDEQNIVFKEELLGTWVEDSNCEAFKLKWVNDSNHGSVSAEQDSVMNGSVWRFSRDGDIPNAYQLIYQDDEAKRGLFSAVIVKVSDRLFLDVFPATWPCGDEEDSYIWGYNVFSFVSVHIFISVDSIEPELKLRVLFIDKVMELLEREPEAISHVTTKDRMVLTAPPKELQAFLLKHVDDEEFFGEPVTLRQKKVAEPPAGSDKDPNEQPSQK